VNLQVDTNILEKHTVSIFRDEDGDSMFLQNTGIYQQVHMALLPRGLTSTSSPPENLKSHRVWFCPPITHLKMEAEPISKKIWLYLKTTYTMERILT
jgi:hypothetical protein